MKASELQPQLRIGNFLQDRNGRLCKVKELGEGTIYAPALKGATTSIPNEPIPLTEEWLLKFGFKRRHDQKYYHLKFDRTWVSLDSILVKWYGNALGGIMMLDYVHQLQNIFYAINSEELELK